MILRTGRRRLRTIYLQSPDDPDGDGKLIGIVDTPELAAEICKRVNEHETLGRTSSGNSLVIAEERAGRLRKALMDVHAFLGERGWLEGGPEAMKTAADALCADDAAIGRDQPYKGRVF